MVILHQSTILQARTFMDMKHNKKPVLEAIDPQFGSSIKVHDCKEDSNDFAPTWHFHPEIEIVYVNGGSGKRHIGNHLSYYNNGDLVFIGSNVPHYGFTNRLTQNKSEVVIHLKPDFPGNDFLDLPEMEAIRALLERGKQGIVFLDPVKDQLGAQMEALLELSPFERMIRLLNILEQMAQTEDYQLLQTEQIVLETKAEDNQRLDMIFKWVKQEFKRPISLSEVADMVSMSDPAFSRYFKKKTGKTFTRFVNEHRLVHACKLLSEEHMSITEVCYESGFNNFSHFNKLFKDYTGKSPSDYRKGIRHILE